jgi:hypothetical protein
MDEFLRYIASHAVRRMRGDMQKSPSCLSSPHHLSVEPQCLDAPGNALET